MRFDEELVSTQQNTNYFDHSDSYRPDITSRRFLERFCCIRISLQNKENKFFYYVENEKLEGLLGLNNNIGEYDFDKIINSSLYDLLVYGRAYIEQILYFDKKNNLVKLSFLPVRHKKMIRIFNKLYYSVKKFDGERIHGHIDSKNLVVLKLKDMNYPKNFFKQVFKKQAKTERIYNDLMFSEESKYDFDLVKRRLELKDLKSNRMIYWSQTHNNQFVSEPYLLYRTMKFDLLQKKFLDYVLEQLNISIKKLGHQYGFEGKIQYKAKTDKYDECFEKLNNGQMNCEEVGNIVFQI